MDMENNNNGYERRLLNATSTLFRRYRLDAVATSLGSCGNNTIYEGKITVSNGKPITGEEITRIMDKNHVGRCVLVGENSALYQLDKILVGGKTGERKRVVERVLIQGK